MGRKSVKNEQAFSLVEVLVSVVIIAIVLVGVINIIIFTNKLAVSNNEKLVAVHIANATIQRIKEKPDDYFPLPSESETEISETYDVTNCTTEECRNLYDVRINDNLYKVTVRVSQDNNEKRLRLLNVFVEVRLPEKKIHSKVEGYVNL